MIPTIVGSFVSLMLSGMPIAVMLIIASTLALLLHTSTPLHVIPEQLFNALDNFVLLAIPFFILAGSIMTKGAIARKLIAFVNALVGWFPGGLAMAGIGACIFFAAISGSSPATVVAIGSIMVPALVKAGYHKRFSIGVITTAGSLGIVIPPSIPMILYCLVMNTSVAEMFMAGVVPGIMIGGALMTFTYFQARKHNWKTNAKFSLSAIATTAKDGFWAILLPVIVLGGIYSGLFTPTEAAAVSVIYAIIIEVFIHKECKLIDVPGICKDASILSACLLLILSAALTFNWLLTSEEIPKQLAEFIMAHIESPWMFLLFINLLLLVLGCFMDEVSAVLVLSPLLLDTLNGYGIDLVHFGVVMVLNIQFGMLTPPFGLNLFVSMGMTGEPLTQVARGVIPFLGVMLLCLLFVTYIPQISLFLPDLLLK